MGVIRKKTATRGGEGGVKYVCDKCSADITSTVRLPGTVTFRCFSHSYLPERIDFVAVAYAAGCIPRVSPADSRLISEPHSSATLRSLPSVSNSSIE